MRHWFRILGVILCLLPVAGLACAASERPTYLALGDSYAVGYGASNRSKDGYVPLVFSFLEQNKNENLSLRNLGVTGETSGSLIATGQLGIALAELRFRNNDGSTKNDVFVITIDVGVNDIDRLAAQGGPCVPPAAVTSPTCQTDLTDALTAFQENLMAILRSLRVAAGPDVKILVLDYPNPYSGTGQPLEKTYDAILPMLNGEIADVASAPDIGARVVETFAAFEGKGPQLTNVDGPLGNTHPNNDGYRLIADLLIAAYQK